MTAILIKYNSNKELYFKISKDLGNMKKKKKKKDRKNNKVKDKNKKLKNKSLF